MKKKARSKKKPKQPFSRADLYALFVKPGDILFQQGERVNGFLI